MLKNIMDIEEDKSRNNDSRILLMSSVRKQQVPFFLHMMSKEDLEHIITTGKLKRIWGRGSQREGIVLCLMAWLNIERVKSVIFSTKDSRTWKNMITNHMTQGTIWWFLRNHLIEAFSIITRFILSLTKYSLIRRKIKSMGGRLPAVTGMSANWAFLEFPAGQSDLP